MVELLKERLDCTADAPGPDASLAVAADDAQPVRQPAGPQAEQDDGVDDMAHKIVTGEPFTDRKSTFQVSHLPLPSMKR